MTEDTFNDLEEVKDLSVLPKHMIADTPEDEMLDELDNTLVGGLVETQGWV